MLDTVSEKISDPVKIFETFLLYNMFGQWFLAAKCSTKHHFGQISVCLHACLGPSAFLTFTQKIFRQPIPENL